MTAHTIAEAFADAASRLIGDSDVAGSLVALLTDCVALIDAESAGILIEVPGDGLALLASTSHTSSVLELYELQNGRGPCIQAIRENVTITATVANLPGQWGPVGRAIVDAGYQGVYAFPLRFGDQAVGALNLFTTAEGELDDEQQRVGQAFANMAVAVVAHPPTDDWSAVHRQITDVLADRTTIEHAKGVLAVQHDIEVSDAYALLVRTAANKHMALARYATQVVVSAGPNSRLT